MCRRILGNKKGKAQCPCTKVAPEPRYVAEFVDEDNKGKFDGYTVLRITRNKEEYVTPHYCSWRSPKDPRRIHFHTPFGGTMQREFSEDELRSVYKSLGYLR